MPPTEIANGSTSGSRTLVNRNVRGSAPRCRHPTTVTATVFGDSNVVAFCANGTDPLHRTRPDMMSTFQDMIDLLFDIQRGAMEVPVAAVRVGCRRPAHQQPAETHL